MQNLNALLSHLHLMRHSPAHNYVIPGLTSWLIGKPDPIQGCVRMFSLSREHEEPIIPHSHRFDFECLVLDGMVTNNIWEEHRDGDTFQLSQVSYEGVLGKHTSYPITTKKYAKRSTTYKKGDTYGMKAEQFHSIYFSKGAEVLFFEGVNRVNISHILEAVVDGQVIPQFKTEPWMFRKESRA